VAGSCECEEELICSIGKRLRGVDGRILLKWILKRLLGGRGLEWYGSGYLHVAGSCECEEELICSIEREGFLD